MDIRFMLNPEPVDIHGNAPVDTNDVPRSSFLSTDVPTMTIDSDGDTEPFDIHGDAPVDDNDVPRSSFLFTDVPVDTNDVPRSSFLFTDVPTMTIDSDGDTEPFDIHGDAPVDDNDVPRCSFLFTDVPTTINYDDVELTGRMKRVMSVSPEKPYEKRHHATTSSQDRSPICISSDESEPEPPRAAESDKREGIYGWGDSKKQQSEKIVEILVEYLAGRIPKSKIAQSPIVAPNESCTIVLDPQASGLKEMEDWQDATDDQMGVWIHNGTNKEKRFVNGTQLTYHRRYWKNDLDCLRKLYFFTTDDCQLVGPWIICYTVPPCLKGYNLRAESQNKPHGNARKPTAIATSYVRTKKSVLKEIDFQLGKNGTSISEKYEKISGENFLTSSGPSSEPRGLQQMYNRHNRLKKKNNDIQSKDWVNDMMRKSAEQRHEDFPAYKKSIRQFNAGPIEIVVALDGMLEEMATNCSLQRATSPAVVGLDETFEASVREKLYLTPITFENTRYIEVRTQKSPTMVSAFLLHECDQAATLAAMFGRVKSLCPDLSYLLATITDRGSAIDAARRSSWIQTVHLFCFRHARKNFVDKMKEYKLSERQAHSEADTIFGRRDGGEGFVCLCDLSSEEFGAACESLQEHWVTTYGEKGRTMCSYFRKDLKNDIERGMLSSVRESAGLKPLSKPTTNPSESMNEKAQRRYMQQQLPDVPHVLVATLCGLLEGQLTDMARARIGQGSGRYRLNIHHPDYRKLLVDRDRFERLIPEDRERFKYTGVVPRRTVTAMLDEPTVTLPFPSDDIEKSKVVNVLLRLGMTQQTGLQLYLDARHLVDINGGILQMPHVQGRPYMVSRKAVALATPLVNWVYYNPTDMHLVRCERGERQAANACITYQTNKVCRHVLAVALKTGSVEGLLSHLQETPAPAMNTVLKAVANPGGGRKGNKAPRKRDRLQTQVPVQDMVRIHPHIEPRPAAGPGEIETGPNILHLTGPSDDEQHFFYVKEKGLARKCRTCGADFAPNESVVVRHVQKYTYPVPNGGGARRTKVDAVHYHFSIQCLRASSDWNKHLLKFPNPNTHLTAGVLDGLKKRVEKW